MRFFFAEIGVSLAEWLDAINNIVRSENALGVLEMVLGSKIWPPVYSYFSDIVGQ